MPMTPLIPGRVLDAYKFSGHAVETISGGLINQTYRVGVNDSDGVRAVVQRLHPVFGREVNIDLDAITTHLADAGFVTPRLIRTRDDARWVEHDGHIWRALTFIEGATIHRIDDPASAAAAGRLVGDFHRAVVDLEYQYAFARTGVHDTPAHLDKLRRAIDDWRDSDDPFCTGARELGVAILDAADELPDLSGLPLRHTHGDLKISNILFATDDPGRAICLLDLDTLGRQTLAYELGDALRSWCNPKGEDIDRAHVRQDILTAALDGYSERAGDLLTSAEWEALIPGTQTVCVELAARFCADVFHDAYFGWDASRFSCRPEHNLVRARGQLALAHSIDRDRAAMSDLLDRIRHAR